MSNIKLQMTNKYQMSKCQNLMHGYLSLKIDLTFDICNLTLL